MRQTSPLLAIVLCVTATVCRSETVYVKYRGPVDLAPFSCALIERSSVIRRVCYDRANASNQARLVNSKTSDGDGSGE